MIYFAGYLEWVGRSLADGQVSDTVIRDSPAARGKSEHHRAADWLTARRGDPMTSATENRPADGARMLAAVTQSRVPAHR